MKNLFIGIDIGTQSIKTALCNDEGSLIAEYSVDSNLVIENEFTAYEDADKILDNVVLSIKKVIEIGNVDPSQIKGLGVDSQMAGIMAIDKNYNAVGPYDSWIDTRCFKYTDLIRKTLKNKGLVNSGSEYMHSHISKVLWRKYERPDEYVKISKFIQISAYISGKLCNLTADKAYNDSTYIHFNVCAKTKEMAYDNKLLKKLGIDKELMPRIVNSTDIVGAVSGKYAQDLGLTDCKVIAGCGDTAASSLGAGIVKENLAYDVAGTASVFACATKEFKPDIKNKTLLFSRSVVDGLYLPLSYVTGGGMCLKWFSNIVGKSFDELNKLASEVKDSEQNSVIFIPHFAGRSFPLNNEIRGAFLGLTNSTTIGEMYLAILESIAFEYKIYSDILRDSGAVKCIEKIYGVGGGSKSSIFCQTKANILGAKYIALSNCNSASVAVAMLAAKSTGYRASSFEEIFKINENESHSYLPDMNKNKTYIDKFNKYKNAVNSYHA